MPHRYKFLRSLPPLRQVEGFKADPVGAQERLLRKLLTRARDTQWGRRLGFAEILREKDIIAAYQARVPLQGYEEVRADIERVRRGERDVMWPGRHRHFAVSSGTASAGKIIPLSQDMLNANKRFSVGTGLNYLRKSGDASFIFGKHLTLPGRIEESADYPGTLVGEVSGLQAENAPKFFSSILQAIPNEVSFLPNWEQKLEAIADRSMEMDIRLVVMAPTWGLTFFQTLIERYNRRHNASAASVGEIWPKLRVFISGGVALKSYHTLLEEAIGLPEMQFIETYGASEGFFSFQDQLDDPSMLLHLDNGVFFEFVPMDRLGADNPPRLTVADVEPDVRYAMYVSTCSGLWAYGVGDVVRFTGTFPHRILVAGRTSEMVDLYGEAVFGEEARDAVRTACKTTGARVRDFHLAPIFAARERLPRHEWLIEFEAEPSDSDLFAAEIDRYLQEVNRHYQIRREARAFESPVITPLAPGTFYEWLKETKGRVSGQTKVPRMSEERAIADRVVAIGARAQPQEVRRD